MSGLDNISQSRKELMPSLLSLAIGKGDPSILGMWTPRLLLLVAMSLRLTFIRLKRKQSSVR